MIAAKVFRVKKADKDKIIRIPNDPSRREDEWDIIRMFTDKTSIQFLFGVGLETLVTRTIVH